MDNRLEFIKMGNRSNGLIMAIEGYFRRIDRSGVYETYDW